MLVKARDVGDGLRLTPFIKNVAPDLILGRVCAGIKAVGHHDQRCGLRRITSSAVPARFAVIGTHGRTKLLLQVFPGFFTAL